MNKTCFMNDLMSLTILIHFLEKQNTKCFICIFLE